MAFSRYNIAFIILVLADFALLILTADSFSISYKESVIYFDEVSLLSSLTNFSTSIFGQNDLALRLPFILFYVGSVLLLYMLTDNYFKEQSHRLISIIIFMLLPGVNSAAFLVNEAILVIFFTLLYLYLFKLTNKEHYWLLFFCLFIDNSFAVMYLALFFYSLQKKDNILLLVSLILFGISMQMYGFESGGHPEGYFLDTFGTYASIFSPIIFIYFFYSMYRIAIKGTKDLYWYISFTALSFSLLFSLRQEIEIEDFAPFIVISIPLMVKHFMHSYRVRLPQFRKKHYIFAFLNIGILILMFLLFILHKPLYLIIKNPSKNFAYDYHIAKELSVSLKNMGISNILSNDYKLQNRLKYYGIYKSQNNYITTIPSKEAKLLSIKYFGKTVQNYYITSLK